MKTKYLINCLLACAFWLTSTSHAESNINYLERGAVTPILESAVPGEGYISAAVGALEGQQFLKTGKLNKFSTQQIIDCAGENIKNIRDAYNYIKEIGIMHEADYRYTGLLGAPCRATNASAVKISGYKNISLKDEGSLAAAIARFGPLSVSIKTAPNFELYSGGIYDGSVCSDAPEALNHGVLAVGFGSEDSVDYYIMKTAMGTRWGERGYMKLSRSSVDQCGLSRAMEASYPTL